MRTNAARLTPLGATFIVFYKEDRALRTQAWEGVQWGRLPPLADFLGFQGTIRCLGYEHTSGGGSFHIHPHYVFTA